MRQQILSRHYKISSDLTRYAFLYFKGECVDMADVSSLYKFRLLMSTWHKCYALKRHAGNVYIDIVYILHANKSKDENTQQDKYQQTG